MATTSQYTIMEEREELMVSPKLPNPTPKIARFLKPSATSIDVQPFPFHLPTASSALETCSSNVSFKGWRNPQKDWKSWVDRMHSLHQSTWKNAGIEQAVLNSSYEIMKNDDLVLGFAQKWCRETKTFAFIWGEATITLEDMMFLGGYSVLGGSVLTPVENSESTSILTKLNEAKEELSRSTYRKADQFKWMQKFKDSGSEIEHEAFLILWLSRFVFPSSYSTVVRRVFPVAIHLSRGIKLALAPAILATIYKDLSMLKAKLFDSDNSRNTDENPIKVWAPLQLVQIWIWERFPKLNPNFKDPCNCKPRFAKWDKKNLQIDNVGRFLDCDLEYFCWRPYATNENDDLGNNHEKGRWVVLGDSLDEEEMETWVRFSRVSELVGIRERCIEQYLPHRVAMQFGIDQDIPGDVPRNNLSPEFAWRFYTRSVTDAKLYLPSRFSEPCVTVRYLEWRNKSIGGSVKDESRTERSKKAVGLDLEARIKKLEEVFGCLKAKKYGRK